MGNAVLALVKAAQILAGVEAHYQGIPEQQSAFAQEYEDKVVGKTSKSGGNVYLRRGGGMYWSYLRPDAKQFVSDGKTVWFVDAPNQQVFVQTGAALPAAVTFLTGQGSLANDYTASLDPRGCRRPKVDCLKLVPKRKSAGYQAVWLAVDPKTHAVTESLVLEPSGNTVRITFSKTKNSIPKGTKFTVDTKALAKRGWKII